MNEVETRGGETDRPDERSQKRITWFFALVALLLLALWAWTELRLRAEREVTRSVQAEKSVLEGEAQRSGIRERLRDRRTGISLATLSKIAMSPADESSDAKGRVYVDGGSGRVFGFFEGLDVSRTGMSYQLWFQPVNDPPESVGTVVFDDEGDGIVTSTGLAPDYVTGQFVLTLEQEGGALVPTGPDVLRGTLDAPSETDPEQGPETSED